MGRPKKSNVNEMATQKIEDAFWRLLEKEKYSNITILRITQESGVNRNSFYYHYQDINDLTYKTFRNTVNYEVYKSLLSILLSEKQTLNDIFQNNILLYSKRIMLCARNDSNYLRKLVSEFLKETWFNSLSINEQLLSTEEKLQVNFIFEGLVTILGSKEIEKNPLIMSALSQTEIGKAAISTMKKIATSQKSKQSELNTM